MVVFLLTRSAARALRRSEMHPMRGWQGEIVRRDRWVATTHLAIGDDEPDATPTERPVGTDPDR